MKSWIASSQVLLAMTLMTMHHPPPSSPANGSAEWPPDDRLQRVSSTPRVLDSIAGVSEYWIVRRSLSSGAHSRDPVADDDERGHSRGTTRSRFCKIVGPLK
jgi:hypothetical protein